MLKKARLSLVEIKRKLGKGQMSEAGLRPIGAYAPVGSRGSGDEQTDGIDLLAKREAEVVRSKMLKFVEDAKRQGRRRIRILQALTNTADSEKSVLPEGKLFANN